MFATDVSLNRKSTAVHFKQRIFACMKKALLPIALILLFAIEFLNIWFLMPFPGSQQKSMIGFSWFMHHQIWWMRLCLYILISWQVLRLAIRKKIWRMVFVGIALVLYGCIAYYLSTRLNPQQMFRMPTDPVYANARENTVSEGKLVVGVFMNGEAKAYPLEILAYHHQIRDKIGRTDVLITYCSLCRSARVYLPQIEGEYARFSLVGIDQYNAILEDDVTGSWWQQANGKAIAGKLKGEQLDEIPAQQMSLKRWMEIYPESLVLQADDDFRKQYKQLAGYDEGKNGNALESRNETSGSAQSWVVVATVRDVRRAYDWTTLEKTGIIQDTLNHKPIAIVLDKDGVSFYGFYREQNGVVYSFKRSSPQSDFLTEEHTGMEWTLNGKKIIIGESAHAMEPLPVVQEFNHTFNTFGK